MHPPQTPPNAGPCPYTPFHASAKSLRPCTAQHERLSHMSTAKMIFCFDGQAIPLEVVYEDDHLLVVNKAAGMVIHPAPGNYSGTLVNALLHRFGLPSVHISVEEPSEGAGDSGSREDGAKDGVGSKDEVAEEEEEEEEGPWALPEVSRGLSGGIIRPGIVHRLDKGTTGLLVVAKDEQTLTGLAAQFKAHTVPPSSWMLPQEQKYV